MAEGAILALLICLASIGSGVNAATASLIGSSLELMQLRIGIVRMTEELKEIQNRIDELLKMRIKNPEAFHNSVMEGIMMGLMEARDILKGDEDD